MENNHLNHDNSSLVRIKDYPKNMITYDSPSGTNSNKASKSKKDKK